MASLSCAAAPAAKAEVHDHQARKNLHRLLRKLRHVLVVKHYIDDLKNGAGLRRGGEKLLSKTQDILEKVPGGPAVLSDFGSDSNGAINALELTLESTTSAPIAKVSQSDAALERLPEVPGATGTLNSLETALDSYISHTYDAVRKRKRRVTDVSEKRCSGWAKERGRSLYDKFWIRWARKRRASVRDDRAQDLLLNDFDGADSELGQLSILQGILVAYLVGSYCRILERLSEVVKRLRAVFGVGWFFEWPSGQHPLNSTWPWADVKPSLLVLWGVCWMFMAAQYGRPDRPRMPLGSAQLWPDNGYHNNPGHAMPTPTQRGVRNQPVNRQAMGFDDTSLLPGHTNEGLANRPQQAYLSMAARHLPTGVPRCSQPVHSTGSHYPRSPTAFGPQPSTHSVQEFQSYNRPSTTPGTWNTAQAQLALSNDLVAAQRNNIIPNGFESRFPPNRRSVAESRNTQPQLWRASNNTDTQSISPDPLGENPLSQAATLHPFNHQSIHNLGLPLYQPTTSMPMPSSSSFNYPPLDNMTELHDAQPYMSVPDRAYPQMTEYEQHHDPQQDQPRYPTPPPPLSEHPYTQQQGVEGTADGRMDMPMEQKSESDAQSPGRSKPVPKPDREVTKDANGRFYCNWPGCTEEIKDFGRKCEWSKHMDKHDRPYKCPAEGCEKLPGFTYSGGLLRHEREVHNKHGGPRKQLNCPHPNCKRHTGKGFSRQENLNEHLRRVHTDAGLPINGEETEDDANEQQGGKRKRGRADSADLREEMKRLKAENEELKRQAEAQTAQSAEMMRQIMQLQQAQQLQAMQQHPRMQAPPAQMT